MPTSFLREADKRMLADFCAKLEDCRRSRRLSYAKLSAMSRVQLDTVHRMIIAEGGTIRTFLRLIDAMDHDMILVKRPKRRSIFDVQGAEEQYYKLTKYNATAKKKERDEKRSLKQELLKAEFDKDFLNNTD